MKGGLRCALAGVFSLLCIALSCITQAHDNSTSASSLGFAWLHDRQLSDGAILNDDDLADALQSTFEAAIAFANSDQLDHLDTAALSIYLEEQSISSAEYLAKELILKLKLEQSVEEQEAALLALQNHDGGFGNDAGFSSTVYDTAFAMQALALTRHKNTSVTGRAVGFLLRQQQPDGGFDLLGNSGSSFYLTGLVLRALQPYSYTYNIGEAMKGARDYLLAHTETGSDWPSDWEAAQFLLAVVPRTTDVEQYKGSLNWLKSQQLANGSWQNDVFSTALALQALYLSENISFPEEPDSAVLKGRLVDVDTGQALAGVEIGIAPSPGDAVVTDATGSFVVEGLQPNQYNITYSATGYLAATQEVQAKAGQFIDLGAIALKLAPTTSLISGTVVDVDSKAPLQNAIVAASWAQDSSQVLTGLDGSYSLSVPAGEVALRVSADGYYPVSAQASAVAGASMKFSPGLYQIVEPSPGEDPPPPPSPPLELIGQVLDSETRQPLTAVEIVHVGSGASVLTDSSGAFTFTGLQGGEQAFELSLAGYQGVVMTAVLPDNGRVDAGVIQLDKLDEPAFTTVQGRIIDADTGLGVAGATVAADGLLALADAEGYYSLDGIASLEFVVGANASGYVFSSTQVSLARHRPLAVDISLQPSDIAGIGITAVSAEKPEYEAYERVNFVATLENKTVRERRVRLYVLIKDAQGAIIDRFPAVDTPLPADTSDPEALAHYEQHLADAEEVLAPNETRMVPLEMGWNTGRQLPGRYQVTIQALEGSTSQLVAEQSALFDVLPTQRLTSATVSATPSFALMDSSPEVRIAVSLRNSSNEPTQTTLNYTLKTPSGDLLSQGSNLVQLIPEEAAVEVELGTVLHQFVESGSYPLELSVEDGVVPEAVTAGELFVPPTVRLTVEQDLTPVRVIPGESRKVQIRIRVEGVDGE